MRLLKKCKIERALGTHLFLKGDRCASPKCGFTRRPTVPGIHGQAKKRRNASEFGRQLKEKQKLRFTYIIPERQLNKYFEEVKGKENAADLLLQILEGRLDNVIYRLGFSPSRGGARQLVSHGSILVNKKRISVPSYRVRVGDEVSIIPVKRDEILNEKTREALKKRDMPSWLTVNLELGAATVKAVPYINELKASFNLPAIAEYYSR